MKRLDARPEVLQQTLWAIRWVALDEKITALLTIQPQTFVDILSHSILVDRAHRFSF